MDGDSSKNVPLKLNTNLEMEVVEIEKEPKSLPEVPATPDDVAKEVIRENDLLNGGSVKLNTNPDVNVVEIEEEPKSLPAVAATPADIVKEVIYEDDSLSETSLKLNTNAEMNVVEIEEESETLPVVAAIPYGVAKEVTCEYDEAAEASDITDNKPEKKMKIWTIFALIVAFVLIFIAIVYQVEWNKQRIISQLGPARTRFSEAEDSAETISTVTTQATTTTTEYILSDDYYEDFDEVASRSDSEEYDNEYRSDAPYNFYTDNQEGVKTATTKTITAKTEDVVINTDMDVNGIPAKLQKWSDCSVKRNFTLWPKDNEPTVAYLNGHCLQCICEASSKCSISAKNGPFVISRPYWIDAGLPELNKNDYGHGQKEPYTDDEKYHNCIADPCCAAEAVANFIKRFARDCNNDGQKDCTDHIMLHVLGPKGCSLKELPAIHALRYDMCNREYTKET